MKRVVGLLTSGQNLESWCQDLNDPVSVGDTRFTSGLRGGRRTRTRGKNTTVDKGRVDVEDFNLTLASGSEVG